MFSEIVATSITCDQEAGGRKHCPRVTVAASMITNTLPRPEVLELIDAESEIRELESGPSRTIRLQS